MSIISNLCFNPILKSISLCAGVTFRHPVPKSFSTNSSKTTGIILFTMGTTRFLPFNFRYLLSFGLIATAVSPKIVSGLVVATMMYSSEFSILYFRKYNFDSFSIYKTSSLERVVRASGSQLTIFLSLYIYPSLNNLINMSITDSDKSSSSVNLVLSQSHEHPILFNWSNMIPPCLLVQSHAWLINSDLDISCLFIFFSFNFLTTFASVAIEA